MEDDQTVGHAGPPAPCNEIILVDVEEMGYSTKNNPPTGNVIVINILY